MIFPAFKLGFIGPEMGMVISMFVGFMFGFFLERAGFGSAKKLSAVWYGRDFAVIRVMFTAVITAMIGIFGLHYLGIVDFDLVYVNPTYLWPGMLGAFLLGTGFSVGGFCPGTSAVSSAIGRIDGMVFLVGFFVGVLIFSESFPTIENFYNSGAMGRKLLSDVTPISRGAWVLIITFGGLVAFYVLKKIENMVNKDLE